MHPHPRHPSIRSIPARSRRTVQGCKRPDDRLELTRHEMEWIRVLRALVGDADPPVALALVQSLRRALDAGRASATG